MKKLLLLFCFSFCLTLLQAQCGNLYIAGVIDGPLAGGTPKAVQLCATGTIADLSVYGLGAANNGGGTDGEEYTFPDDIVTIGSCFWASSEDTGFNNFFGFTPCYTSGTLGINGDDAIELFCNGSVVDVFGDINTDGNGEDWEYLDGWAKADDAVASTTFNSNDWTFSGPNALDGESTNAGATTPYPSPDQDCPAPLPVEFISFSAKQANESSASLTWKTASEENNSHFEVEHSTNGRDYQMLDKVIGNGTTVEIQGYNYIHENAATGTNYYRLRQVDFDGAFEYSDVVSLKIEGDAKVQVYPTVADQQIVLSFGETTREDKEVLIYNVAGLQVSAAQVPAGTDQIEVPVAALQEGIYFVQMVVNGEVASFKFVRQVR